MIRTRATTLLALGLLGLVVGFLVEFAAVASGSRMIVPPLSLPFTLVSVALAVVALAWPIRQLTRGRTQKRIDPFWAMRVALIAKACSLSGALLLGMGLGILVFFLTRSVLPAVPSVWLALGSALGAAVLLVAGLLAERYCTLPPDDDAQPGGEHV